MSKKGGFDSLPWIARLILALPGLDFLYGIHRILKGHIIAGIVWLLAGWAVLWIIDIICVILYGRVTVFA